MTTTKPKQNPNLKGHDMYEISNNFHNTFARTLGGRLSERQEKRIKAKLCGISGCCCGGEIGERGPQTCEISYDSDGRVIVTEPEDGSLASYLATGYDG